MHILAEETFLIIYFTNQESLGVDIRSRNTARKKN